MPLCLSIVSVTCVRDDCYKKIYNVKIHGKRGQILRRQLNFKGGVGKGLIIKCLISMCLNNFLLHGCVHVISALNYCEGLKPYTVCVCVCVCM